MTQLEIEINALEASLKTLDDMTALLGGDVPPAITNKRDSIVAELTQKRHQLAAQSQETLYEHLARTVGYSQELDSCIKSTVDQLLDNTVSNASDPGLLLGKIQSGKTRAFVGAMALAMDRGIDACVVLTKPDDGLVEQTFQRMCWEYRDYINNPSLSLNFEIGVYKVEQNMSFSPAQINDQKNIFVVHKNTTRLGYLLDLMNVYYKDKKVMIVDDEADFVSRAFYTSNNNVEAGEVALAIDRVIAAPKYCRYLQVTATPYSLFLQPDHTMTVKNGTVSPFRPRFTVLVPLHANYVGGKQYFIDSQDSTSMYASLFHSIDSECFEHMVVSTSDKRVYGKSLTTPKFATLRDALMSYIVASAIRQIQEEQINKQKYKSSFFMHISTQTTDHKHEEMIVDGILTGWKNDIDNAGAAMVRPIFDKAYLDMADSNKAGNLKREINIFMPSAADVWDRVLSIFSQGQYGVQIVNATTSKRGLLGDDGQLKLANPLNIFIGGFKLDRGITIEHMLGFMYGRSPQNKQADAVLQHHRMYGNRSKEDMAVTRLHTTLKLWKTMEWIDNMDHQLRKIFIEAMKNPSAPLPLIAIQYSKEHGVKPCNKNHLLISDLDSFDAFKRITTFGFQTDCASKVKPVIDGIDNLLSNEPGYQEKVPFLIDKNHVYQILKNIRQTFIYNRPIDHNAHLDWNEDEMIAAIEKYVGKDGKLWCYVVKNRDMSRIRQNGNFVDAPEDGNTDTPIAKATATDRPFLMLFKQKGRAAQGWRDAEFYWPSLRLPLNVKSCMYCK